MLGCRKVSKKCNAKDALLSNSLESKAHGQNPYYAQFGAADAGRSKETRTLLTMETYRDLKNNGDCISTGLLNVPRTIWLT